MSIEECPALSHFLHQAISAIAHATFLRAQDQPRVPRVSFPNLNLNLAVGGGKTQLTVVELRLLVVVL